MSERVLLVTIDTEVDKDSLWQISNPVRFLSVTHGIPDIFSPLFEEFGVKPTYLLSAEVIENEECVAVLQGLMRQGKAELGTHLHGDFVEPYRTRFLHSMAGQEANAIQAQYPRDLERTKLANLTMSFREAFGRDPKCFRAGRFALSDHTLELLAELGYLADSSVTPGLTWRYAGGEVDFRRWSTGARWVETPATRIVELPISIRPVTALAPLVRDLPSLPRRFVQKLGGAATTYRWLRPSLASGDAMVRYVRSSDERILVMMLHSMEIVPGASPYAQTAEEVNLVVSSMRTLFDYCHASGIAFCGMSQAVSLVGN